MNRRIVTITLIILIVLGLCFAVYHMNKKPSSKESNPFKPPHGGVESVVNANNKFCWDLYSNISDQESNIFFSPLSISTAFALLYEGARGETADEIQSLFHFPENSTIRRTSFGSLLYDLNRDNERYELNIANGLWSQRGNELLDEYKNVIEQYYYGKASTLDFQGAPGEACNEINGWVEDQTNDKIKDLFQGFRKETSLVIANALYFKGQWANKFDESDTIYEDFYINENKTVQVPMMRTTAKFNIAMNDKLSILEMPYQGDELSMLILLPHNVKDLRSIEGLLTLENLATLKEKYTKQEIRVFLPKFSLNTKYYLPDFLQKMGMPTAFSPNADFSGIDGPGSQLFLSDVIHQAFVDVNEEGTEAAAATGIEITYGAPLKFRVDRPFIFLIQENETGNILFFGRVVDPSN